MENQKNSLKQTDADFPARQGDYDDEISLYDLWLVLYRRKWWIAGITVLVLGLGVVHWQMQTPQQRYLTSVEIGRVLNGDSLSEVEPRDAFVLRLRESALPMIRQEVAAEHDVGVNELPDVAIRAPEEGSNGAFVFMETSAASEREPLVEALHQSLVQFSEQAHSELAQQPLRELDIRKRELEMEIEALEDERLSGPQRQSIEGQLDEAIDELDALKARYPAEQRARERALEALRGEQGRLEARLDALADEQELIDEQKNDLSSWLAEARQNRLAAAGGDAGLAGTLLMEDAVANAQRDLAQLQEKARIGLPERRRTLESALEENQHSQAELEDAIAEAERQHAQDLAAQERLIDGLRAERAAFIAEQETAISRKQNELERLENLDAGMSATRAMNVALPSGMEGRGGALILALSLALGGMLGVFGAFIAEFHQNAMRRLRGESE